MLIQISTEAHWDLIGFQEFCSDAQDHGIIEHVEGYLVLVQPPCLGRRRAAIAIHRDSIGFVVRDSFVSCGRSCAVDLNWHRIHIRCICFHASADRQ